MKSFQYGTVFERPGGWNEKRHRTRRNVRQGCFTAKSKRYKSPYYPLLLVRGKKSERTHRSTRTAFWLIGGGDVEGFIKLARCLIDKPIFHNEKILKIWIWCLLKASHTEHEQMVGNQKVLLLPGQFLTGRYAGAREVDLNPSTFWKYMVWLKKNQSLDIKSNSKYSLVTIVNWDLYQIELYKSDSKSDSKMTAKEQQNNTNKNGKNVKNNNTYHFDEFWAAFPKKKAKNDAVKAWNKIKMTDELFTEIMTALALHKKTPEWTKDNGQFIPNCSTWLNGKRWEDELLGTESKRDYSNVKL